MIKSLVSDFSRVLLSVSDPSYSGSLNKLHKKLMSEDSNYDFWSRYTFNYELLSFYKTLKLEKGLHIFTTDHIQDHSSVKEIIEPVFSRIFIAKDLGVSKDDFEAYLKIATSLELEISEILYIDDNEENTQSAENAGLYSLVYKDNQSVFAEITKILQIK